MLGSIVKDYHSSLGRISRDSWCPFVPQEVHIGKVFEENMFQRHCLQHFMDREKAQLAS